MAERPYPPAKHLRGGRPHFRRPPGEYEFTPIYPLYDIASGLRDPHRKPEDLLKFFDREPLTKDFVDWVAKEDYIIVYYHNFIWNGRASVSYVWREISLLGNVSISDTNLDLAHELVHIASPASSVKEEWSLESQDFELVIDKIAEPLANNMDFITHARQMLTRPEYTFRNFPDNTVHQVPADGQSSFSLWFEQVYSADYVYDSDKEGDK